MTADPVDDDAARGCDRNDLTVPVMAVQDLAAFAQRNSLDKADGLLTELLAVLHGHKG